MTKKTSSRCKDKKVFSYDSDGIHFSQLMELAETQPKTHGFICLLIFIPIIPRWLIIKIMDWIV